MSDEPEEASEIQPPAIFPLESPREECHSGSDSLKFGWVSANGETVLTVWKTKWTGGWTVDAQWPASEDRWPDVWRDMLSTYPALARAISERVELREVQAQALRDRAANHARLESQGIIDNLDSCVFLGGYGQSNELHPGAKIDVYFTEVGIWITKHAGFKPHLERSYADSHSLEFEGGTVTTGGGYFGGGFGVLGAAEGMAVASLLNSLTTKTTVHTTVRYEADGADIFVFTDTAVPRTLEMRLAQVRGRIKQANRPSPLPAEANQSLGEQLIRLGEMFEKGHLSAEEFALAKARIFGSA